MLGQCSYFALGWSRGAVSAGKHSHLMMSTNMELEQLSKVLIFEHLCKNLLQEELQLGYRQARYGEYPTELIRPPSLRSPSRTTPEEHMKAQ